MREFGKQLTEEQVALASTTALQPFNEPTEIVAVPTDAEMVNWQPDPAPEKMRWRKAVNVQTGEVTYTELSLDEYRARHVAKIISRNEFVLRKREDAKKAKRAALLEKLLDEAEAKRA